MSINRPTVGKIKREFRKYVLGRNSFYILKLMAADFKDVCWVLSLIKKKEKTAPQLFIEI